MKELIINIFVTLLFVTLAIGLGWLAVEMFQQSEWVKGFFCMLGVLLFGAPLLAQLFSKPAPQITEEQLLVQKIPLPHDPKALFALALQLAGDDEVLMQAVAESIEAPKAFYRARAEAKVEENNDYCEVWDSFRNEPEMLRGIGLLYLLKEAKATVVFDWKDSLETFVDEMRELRRLQHNHLPIDDIPLEKNSDIPHWCHTLNKHWQQLGYQTVLIDTDGDEYWVGLSPVSVTETPKGT